MLEQMLGPAILQQVVYLQCMSQLSIIIPRAKLISMKLGACGDEDTLLLLYDGKLVKTTLHIS